VHFDVLRLHYQTDLILGMCVDLWISHAADKWCATAQLVNQYQGVDAINFSALMGLMGTCTASNPARFANAFDVMSLSAPACAWWFSGNETYALQAITTDQRPKMYASRRTFALQR
jgi:hypothetical protein